MELNNIYNMDCIEGMQQLERESVDLIVTDPPYLINYKTNYRKDKNHEFSKVIQNDDNPDLIKNYIKECYRILKQDKAMYMFCSFDKVDFFKKELEKYFKVKNMIVWIKNNWTAGDLEAQYGKQYEIVFLVNKGRAKINGKRLSDVWYFDKVSSEKLKHQNQKPLDLISTMILKHSNKNDIVFDGFMGSGTTAIAAINEKRNYLGFEIDQDKYEVAQKRIENETNQTSIFDFL